MKRLQIFLACIALMLAFVFQFRTFLWSGCPPSWNSMLPTGASLDYLHLIPIQIRTLDSSFYSRDYMVSRVTPLYPRFWRELTALISLRLFNNPITGNWVISCLTFFVAAWGMSLLSYEISGNFLSMSLAVLFLLAGGTDPAGQYFLALGNFAVPHEQALSLFPWILYFLVRRIKKPATPPWEMGLLALAANIHAPTAIDMGLALVSAYCFAPRARPSKTKASFFAVFISVALMTLGALPTLLFLRRWHSPSANFFGWAFPPLYPLSAWTMFRLRAVIIFFFLLRWPAIVFAFWAIARPWRVVKDEKSQVLLSASLPLSLLILGRFFVLIFPFSPSFIMAEFRAFMPAIVPLLPLSSQFWRPMENNRKGNILIFVLGSFLLIRSSPHTGWSLPGDPSHIQEYESDLSQQIRRLTPKDVLILIPDALVSLRVKSHRAVFGDSRALEMLLSFDNKIEKFYWPLYEKLHASYRSGNWPGILRVASILHADYAVLPAHWNPCNQKIARCREIYKNREVSLVQIMKP